MKEKFYLTEGDKQSATWRKLSVELQRRLDDSRVRNDAPQAEESTAMIRGEINCLKVLLALSKPPRASLDGNDDGHGLRDPTEELSDG